MKDNILQLNNHLKNSSIGTSFNVGDEIYAVMDKNGRWSLFNIIPIRGEDSWYRPRDTEGKAIGTIVYIDNIINSRLNSSMDWRESLVRIDNYSIPKTLESLVRVMNETDNEIKHLNDEIRSTENTIDRLKNKIVADKSYLNVKYKMLSDINSQIQVFMDKK